MRNINRNFPGDRLAYSNSTPFLEITESEIVNFDSRRKLQYIYPRHLNCQDVTVDRPFNLAFLQGNENCDRRVNLKNNFYLVFDEIVQNIHLENLRQNLEKRLQAAKIKGDDRLVNLLEKEFQQLAD